LFPTAEHVIVMLKTRLSLHSVCILFANSI